jgi:hypothetical protein
MEYLGILLGLIEIGHSWSIPIIVLVLLIRPKNSFVQEVLENANLLFAAAALLGALQMLGYSGYELLAGKGWAQFSIVNRFFGPYWFVWAIKMAIGTAMPLLLFWQRMRRSIGFSLVCCLQIWLMPFWVSWLLTLLPRTYLPSSWKVIDPIPLMGFWKWICYILILTTIVLIARRWRTGFRRVNSDQKSN